MSGPHYPTPYSWLGEPAHGCATRDPEPPTAAGQMYHYVIPGYPRIDDPDWEPEADDPGTCLDRARRAVDGKRQEEYGSPLTNFSRAATLFDAYLKARPSGPITPEDVAWLNVLQKCARGMHTTTPDTLADVAGYMRCIELLEAERDRLREMEE